MLIVFLETVGVESGLKYENTGERVRMEEFSVIGKSLPNVDAIDKVRGGYDFPSEQNAPGALFGKILRSPVPHARIKNIITAKAERHPGVRAVITWRDLPRVKYHPKIGVDPDSTSMVKDFMVLEDVVRYVGDEVAAVAADSESAALDALDLIEVEYEELPQLRDIGTALKDESSPLHPEFGKIPFKANRGWGNVEEDLRRSDHLIEHTYNTQRVSQFPLETHFCLCDVDRDGNLLVNSSTQMIHGLKERLGTVLEYPSSKIRVARPRYIGGAFGSKLDMNPMEPITAMLAIKSRKAVRMRLTREEEMISTAFMSTTQKVRTGVTKDGVLLAHHLDITADCGAHTSHAPSILMVAASAFLSSYRAKSALFEGRAVYTNNPPAGAYRGYGGPQGVYGVEQQMDLVARELGIDPVELRIRNAWREGDPNPRLGGSVPISSYAFEDCLLKGAEAFGWRWPRPQPQKTSGLMRGIGIACIPMGGSGVSGKKGGSVEMSGAIMKLNVDGAIDLVIATIDQGGGQNTVLSQIAAESAGARVEDIRISKTDTDVSPIDAPTHATRVTYVVGSVVEKAGRELKQKILLVAAELLGAEPADLVVGGSVVSSQSDKAKQVSFKEIAKHTIFTAPGRQLIGESMEISPLNPTPSGAHFVEVEVDPETGKVLVKRYLAVHDVGRAINPRGIDGQIIGGIVQGLGYALSEHLFLDDSGNLGGLDLGDYKILGSLDVPDIRTLVLEKPDPSGPFGAKGVSEPAITPVAAAVANAVHDAIGVRIGDLPITCESVLRALSQREQITNPQPLRSR